MAGTATLRLAPIADGLRDVTLDGFELTIRDVKDEAGKALDFEVRGEAIVVRLGRARKADREFELRIRYECHPRKGLFFTHPDKAYPDRPRIVWSQGEDMDNRAWFPSYDYPNQRFTSELIVTVKAPYRAVANGRLIKETRDGRRKTRTFHWLQDTPHANYLIALVAGEWDSKEWDADGVPVQAFVPKGMGKFIDLCFSRVPDMVRFYGRVTGQRFPWDKYAQACVPDFTFGGMENTSLTVLYLHCLTDERAYPDYSSDALLSHELAHQWFGDFVTCRGWGHLWLNESFADYFECLWWEERYGKDEFLMHLEDLRQIYFDEAREKYKRPIVTARFVDAEDLSDYHTYNKGCAVLHMMRYLLGDDAWWRSIRRYVSSHALGNVETNDLKEAIEEATGRNLDWFFNEWLYKAGHPEFEVSWAYDDVTRQAELKVKQVHALRDDIPLFRVPVVLEFATDERVWRESIQVDQAEQTFRIASTVRPRMVLFDPDGALLKQLRFKKEKDELLWQLLHAETVWGRMEAADGLGRFVGDASVVEALDRALAKEAFWGVKRSVAKALGEIGTEGARDALLAHAGDKDSRVRRAVYRALGKFAKDDVAFRALKKGYLQDPKYYPAAAAAFALAETRHPEALDAIVEGMDRPSQLEMVSRGASKGIAHLRDAKGIEALETRTRYGQPEMRRYGAAMALGQLGYYHERRHDDVLDILRGLLRDPNFRTRTGAAIGLGYLGYQGAEPELEKVQDTEIMGHIRAEARNSVAEIRARRRDLAKRMEQQDELDKLKDRTKELEGKLAALEAKVGALAKRRG